MLSLCPRDALTELRKLRDFLATRARLLRSYYIFLLNWHWIFLAQIWRCRCKKGCRFRGTGTGRTSTCRGRHIVQDYFTRRSPRRALGREREGKRSVSVSTTVIGVEHCHGRYCGTSTDAPFHFELPLPRFAALHHCEVPTLSIAKATCLINPTPKLHIYTAP